jgi:hypothetical protein
MDMLCFAWEGMHACALCAVSIAVHRLLSYLRDILRPALDKDGLQSSLRVDVCMQGHAWMSMSMNVSTYARIDQLLTGLGCYTIRVCHVIAVTGSCTI